MRDSRHTRITRELFLTAFGAELGQIDGRTIDRLTWLLEEDDALLGDTLFAEGDAPEYFYFLRSGRVELVRHASAAQIAEGPAVVGMFDAVLDRPRPRTGNVVADAQIMKVPIDDWMELLEDSFGLARASVLSAARQVAHLEERLLERGIVPWKQSDNTSLAAGRLGMIERMAALMGALPFREATVQTVSDLARVTDEVEFEPGETVFEPVARRDRVLLVVQGDVAGTAPAWSSEAIFGPGHIVCGAAACGDAPCAWGARARTHVRTLTFRTEDWFDLMEEHFDLVRSALAGLAVERERLLDLLATTAPA
jgi:CRP-like cAMP-binding protein